MLIKSNSKKRICRTIKKIDGTNADRTQSMLVLPILEKNNCKRLKFSQGSVTVL